MINLGARLVLAVAVAAATAQRGSAAGLEEQAASGAAALEGAGAGLRAILDSARAGEGVNGRQRLLNDKLRQAASSANVAEMRRLVALGADPNADDGFSMTPLASMMLSHGLPEAVSALLDLGARADFKGTCDVTALHYAAAYTRLAAARMLVARGATPDARACLGATPLVEAAKGGHKDMSAWLLGLGADPNAADYEGKTPLMLSVQFLHGGRKELAALLLADARTDVNRRDKDGMTALKLAVKARGAEAVKLLLAAPGIDVNDEGGGVTALFLAELNGDQEIAELLRKAGATSKRSA